jgi:methyl-accepting chemotaxis protein
MTFRRSAPATIVAAVVLVIAGVTFASNRLFSGLTAEVENAQFRLMQSIVHTALSNAADNALARAEIVSAMPSARDGVASKDHDRLLAEFALMFAGQKERHGVDQAQFHVPPATSLLRLQDPATFGDDLTRFRPIVVAVNREKAARKGLAIARSGPAIFGVTPVLDPQGRHAGSFEIGLEFGPLLEGLKAAYGLDFAFFVEEKPLREFARGLNPAVLSDQNRVGHFIRYHSTNGSLAKALVADADIAAVAEPTRYVREGQGLPYGVLLVPVRDGAGEPLGVIMVASDFSGSRAASGRALVWQICIAIFAIVVLAGTVIVVIRGFLLRPLEVLDQRAAALVAGQRKTALEPTDKFCTEIAGLAAHIERIAKQAADSKPASETKS